MAIMWHIGLLVVMLVTTIGGRSEDLTASRLHEILSEAVTEVLSRHAGHEEEYQPGFGSLDFLSDGQEQGRDREHGWKEKRNKRSVPIPVPVPPVIPGHHPFIRPVPHLAVNEADFSHEYVSETGVGNREEITLTGVSGSPVRLVVQQPPTAWRFIRFDSSGYFLSVHRSLVTVWRTSVDPRSLSFDPSSIVCQMDVRPEGGEVIGSELHTMVVYQSTVLRVALLMRTTKWNQFQLRTYEVRDRSCFPTSVLEVKPVPKKMAFVSSHYESGVVVLVEDARVVTQDLEVDFKQISHSSSDSRLIQVSVPNPVDMEAFNVAGHSYIVTGTTTGILIGRLNEFLTHYMPFDFIPVTGVTDVAAFSMGFDHFLAVTTSGHVQYVYEWREGSFHLKQTLAISKVGVCFIYI